LIWNIYCGNPNGQEKKKIVDYTQNLKHFLKYDFEFFPNIKKLLTIISTLSVSTTTTEKTFSTLKRIKSYLRNSTGN
jgi:hypothetical protein